MTALQKGPSKAKSPAKGKLASPDTLTKTGKESSVELTEGELKRTTGGISLYQKDGGYQKL